jgi:hypothetical protein
MGQGRGKQTKALVNRRGDKALERRKCQDAGTEIRDGRPKEDMAGGEQEGR